MAEEIDQDLLVKIKAAIEEAMKESQFLLSKLAFPHTQLQNVKKILFPDGSEYRRVRVDRDLLYRLNNVLTEWLMLSKKQSSYSPEPLLLASSLNTTLKEIKKKITGGDGSSGGTTNHKTSTSNNGSKSVPSATATADESLQPKKLEIYRWSTRYVDETKVHGFDHEKMSLERMLVSGEGGEGFKAVGIFGMRGVGKTTLCQVIFNHEKVQKCFVPRIWVCLSKQPDQDSSAMNEAVKRILRCLGVEKDVIKSVEDSHKLRGLLYALKMQLMGKKYLIVLDDAWSDDKGFKDLGGLVSHKDEGWGEKLAYGLPKGEGGTIIVTSRSKGVAKDMVGEDNLRPLLPLEDKKSLWLIFKESVEVDGGKFPKELESLEGEIVDKCAGLPLAAKLMGQIALVAENKPSESGQEQQQQQS